MDTFWIHLVVFLSLSICRFVAIIMNWAKTFFYYRTIATKTNSCYGPIRSLASAWGINRESLIVNLESHVGAWPAPRERLKHRLIWGQTANLLPLIVTRPKHICQRSKIFLNFHCIEEYTMPFKIHKVLYPMSNAFGPTHYTFFFWKVIRCHILIDVEIFTRKIK